MLGSEYILEVHNVFHSVKVGSDGCLNSDDMSALILKSINMTVHSTEVMAILGSKGSGKRALLDVISKRADGETHGQILLNGISLSKSLFQEKCGYVTQSNHFIPGLKLIETLQCTPCHVSGRSKEVRLRQILADLALSQVKDKKTENLNQSEMKRLAIGLQLVKNPAMLLLDEPTQNLDPLNAYLLISILSNCSKKNGCGIILSLEKPRSDVFPFLDRALFLCLGGMIYSGGTRNMLEYFDRIGFPCPQLENPLMYYLCLSTVDRRSRDRFIESSQQIEALVERFAKEQPLENTSFSSGKLDEKRMYKWPSFSIFLLAIRLLLLSTFSFSFNGFKLLLAKFFTFPIMIASLAVIYSLDIKENITSEKLTRLGLILNLLALSCGSGYILAFLTFPTLKRQIISNERDVSNSGFLLYLAYNVFIICASCISALGVAGVLYLCFYQSRDYWNLLEITLVLWACHIIINQISAFVLMITKSELVATILICSFVIFFLIAGTGTVKSHKEMLGWLQQFIIYSPIKYVSTILFNSFFIAHLCNTSNNLNNCTHIKAFVTERTGYTDAEIQTQSLINIIYTIVGSLLINIILFKIIIYRLSHSSKSK